MGKIGKKHEDLPDHLKKFRLPGISEEQAKKAFYDVAQALKPKHPRTGPGLFEFLDEGNVIPYDPTTNEKEVPYQLSDKEKDMFAKVGDDEEVKTAIEVYKKLKGPVFKGSIDEMVEQIKDLWYDKVTPPQRKLQIWTDKGGLELFHKTIKEQYGQP